MLQNYRSKKAWSADGSTTFESTAAMPAVAATGVGSVTASAKGGCTTCQKKRMACLAAGVLLGVVATMLLTKTKASA